MRLAIGAILSLLLCGCSSFDPKTDSRVVVVDRNGTPAKGILVEPEPQDAKDAEFLDSQDDYVRKNWTTDAQGMMHTDLQDYYWDSDSCYHFHIHHYGYEDFEISVAKDLMPPVYKITLRDRVVPSN